MKHSVRLGALAIALTLTTGLALATSACEGNPPPASDEPVLLTLGDLERGLSGPSFALGVQDLFPDGIPPSKLLKMTSAEMLETPIVPAYAEGEPAGYTTTDLWFNFPEVWAQPMYVFVRPDAAGVPAPIGRPIFSVGPKSRFYSPYWRVFQVSLPAGGDPDRYRSVRQIRDAKLPIREIAPRLCVLAPNRKDFHIKVSTTHPLLGAGTVATVGQGEGYVDGESEPVDVLSFGEDRFRFDARQVVAEQPLFVFTVPRQGDGVQVDAQLPRVGGTGPLGAQAPALGTQGAPTHGSLWRLHRVRLPGPTSAVPVHVLDPMIPGLGWDPEAARAHAPGILVAAPLTVDEATRRRYAFRAFVGERTCVDAPNAFGPGSPCRWLDSQRAIEETLAGRIDRTEILVNCPYVTFRGAPAPPPRPTSPTTMGTAAQ